MALRSENASADLPFYASPAHAPEDQMPSILDAANRPARQLASVRIRLGFEAPAKKPVAAPKKTQPAKATKRKA